MTQGAQMADLVHRRTAAVAIACGFTDTTYMSGAFDRPGVAGQR